MLIRFVRVFLGKSRMEVTVTDDKGMHRKIMYKWHTKERTDVPPANWPSAIEGEVKYQQQADFKRSTGRQPPFR